MRTLLTRNIRIEAVWVPGNSIIPANERVDKMAALAIRNSTLIDHQAIELSIEQVRSISPWPSKTHLSTWCPLWYNFLPRSVATPSFRCGVVTHYQHSRFALVVSPFMHCREQGTFTSAHTLFPRGHTSPIPNRSRILEWDAYASCITKRPWRTLVNVKFPHGAG